MNPPTAAAAEMPNLEMLEGGDSLEATSVATPKQKVKNPVCFLIFCNHICTSLLLPTCLLELNLLHAADETCCMIRADGERV